MSSCFSSQGINLLRFKPIRTLILWSGFPYVFQGMTLALFVYLAVIGWSMQVPEGVNGKLYAKSNLVNLVIWGLWWPSMIWMAVLFGRLWCTVCPMELVSNAAERLGRALRIPQMRLSSWLRSGALVLLLYLIIQMLVAGLSLHRVPFYTSIFLWSMLALAAISGLLIKDRGFCRGFCPVALLLNTYGRGGMLAVRSGENEKCQACTGKECMQPSHRTQLDARSCPSLLNPSQLHSNRDCLVCGQCLKACQSDNMQLILRRPFHPADAREPFASWPMTLFVMLASGFVSSELCSEWPKANEYFTWFSHTVAAGMSLEAYAGWIEGVWMLLVFPVFLWLLLGCLVKYFSPSISFGQIWRRLALPIAVVVAAGHMTKALAKFSSWVGFFPYAFQEPSGTQTVAQFASKAIVSPSPIVSTMLVSCMGLTLLTFGAYFAWKELYYAENPTHKLYAVPLIAVVSAWSFIVWGIGFGN